MKYMPETREALKKLCDDLTINLGDIDTSKITDMHNLFDKSKRTNFSGIEDWDVSNVTDMYSMFEYAIFFNQPIGDWNVSNVTDMSFMFNGADSFNQPIGSWDVSNVTDMSFMFNGAKSFNQPLDRWNVSNVTDMSYMFKGAKSFNQPIGNWDVSNVTDMHDMFSRAHSFNQPIGNWNISNVKVEHYGNNDNLSYIEAEEKDLKDFLKEIDFPLDNFLEEYTVNDTMDRLRFLNKRNKLVLPDEVLYTRAVMDLYLSTCKYDENYADRSKDYYEEEALESLDDSLLYAIKKDFLPHMPATIRKEAEKYWKELEAGNIPS